MLAVAKPANRAVVHLESPGGVVHDGGIAITRRDKYSATVTVDKVATAEAHDGLRGGKKCAAPFAVWGQWCCRANSEL